MHKLKSFDQFATETKITQTRKLEEESNAKRGNEAETFKSLLSEFSVTSIKELTEEQRSEFFTKLRGVELNESVALIEEGTRGQFGKIDKKGNITSIYTHYDSYPENMLPLIKKGYKGGKNVDVVIKGGNSSGLEETPGKMNFYKDGTKNLTGTIANVKGYLQDASDDGGAEYVYLWDEANKEWLMADIYGKMELVPAFESVLFEATVTMDAMNPEDKDFLKFLKKNKVEIIDMVKSGPTGHPEITMQGKRKDLEAVLADDELGWDDAGLADYIEESFVNEAIQVEYKRDAKKVATVYRNLFTKKLTDFGSMSNEGKLGCIKYLFEFAMEDANFSREGFQISKNIKGRIGSFELKAPGLGNHFLKIGATTTKRILDKYYSDIANAAGWSGIGIVEGTALYLESIKQEAMGQSLLNAFNTFNESVVNESEVTSDEEFKEYAVSVLQQAFGEDYDEAKANKVIDGILAKCGDDYGACVGTLTSSLGESVEITEANADGTISDDEDDRRESLIKRVEDEFDGLLATAELDAKDIGGPFRSPGIMADIRKVLDKQVKKFK